MVMAQWDQTVLLERRPPSGIWGGLWSFPEAEPDADIELEIAQRYGVRIERREQWKTYRHSFTHFHLDITPIHTDARPVRARVMEKPEIVWYNLHEPDARGLAAPVKRLLDKLR